MCEIFISAADIPAIALGIILFKKYKTQLFIKVCSTLQSTAVTGDTVLFQASPSAIFLNDSAGIYHIPPLSFQFYTFFTSPSQMFTILLPLYIGLTKAGFLRYQNLKINHTIAIVADASNSYLSLSYPNKSLSQDQDCLYIRIKSQPLFIFSPI